MRFITGGFSTILRFCALFLFLIGSTAASWASLEIPIAVRNTLEQDRQGEPVVSGVPFPGASAVTEAMDLVLLDASGRPVPAQFRPLARRGPLEDTTAPIKWAEVIFQPEIAAGEVANFTVAEGLSPGGPLTVTEDAETITIRTGSRTFTISTVNFDLFSTAGYQGEGVVVLKAGVEYRSGPAEEIVIEEDGPLRACIRVVGRLYSPEGDLLVGGDARPKNTKSAEFPIEYKVRLYFYADRDEVKVETTLMNNSNGLLPYYAMNDLFIDGLYLVHTIPQEEGLLVYDQGVSSPIDPSRDTFRLSQGYAYQGTDQESENFFYRTVKNGLPEDGGSRVEGYASLAQEGKGVTVCLKNFWQKWPKSFEIQEGALRVGLLPEYDQELEEGEYGSGYHYFSGGWHSTDEVLYRFHDGTEDPAERYAAFAAPMIAAAPPAFYAEAEGWGPGAPEGFIPSQPEVATALERYSEYAAMPVDPAASLEGKDLQAWREERANGNTWYKWEHFGCIPWDGGIYSMLHYDWAYGMWLQFLRTADPEYFHLADVMTSHSSDLDQIHQGDPEEGTTVSSFSGLWWWEDGGPEHHKSLNTSGWEASHTWNGGYALGYLLTGNRRYLEAADLGARAGRQIWSAPIEGQDKESSNTRAQGWSILMLLNRYKVTGDPQDLQDALNLFRHATLYTEQLPDLPGSDGSGYITYSDGYVYVTFATYHLEPLCELHALALQQGLEVQDLEDFLIRALDWLKDYAYGGGTTNAQGDYNYLTISYKTDPENPEANTGGELAHNVHVADAFGYGWLMLREKDPTLAKSYLDFARHLFRDLMYYRTVPYGTLDWSTYHDPAELSPIEWGWLPTASKELGWLYRGGQIYRNAEYRQPPQDATPPRIETFVVPQVSTSRTVAVEVSASDDMAVTGYWLGESTAAPSLTDPAWSAEPPQSWTFGSDGYQTLCARARDAEGNISQALCRQITVDSAPPVVTAFDLPRYSFSLYTSVRSFAASDNLEVTGYLLTESSLVPDPWNAPWSSTPPSSYLFDSSGTKTLYAWARDRAGNVSKSASDSVYIRSFWGRWFSSFLSEWNR